MNVSQWFFVKLETGDVGMVLRGNISIIDKLLGVFLTRSLLETFHEFVNNNTFSLGALLSEQ